MLGTIKNYRYLSVCGSQNYPLSNILSIWYYWNCLIIQLKQKLVLSMNNLDFSKPKLQNIQPSSF